MDPLQPGDPRRVGKYRLVGRLGEGGMGRVFFGRSPGGRPVAVKLIRYEYAQRDRFRARFAREVEAARRVGGFHTALVIDADPEADPPWMVTAYIPGPSLHGAVTAHGPLDGQAVRILGAGLAEGLAAIHACGLVHRDLKPGNVVLAADGPRIIDFGIAGTQDAGKLTATGAVLGTYAYMSPEQVNGHRPEAAGDVFALGAVLGFAATGHSPFHGETTAAILHRITSEPPDLRGLAVEHDLGDLIVACLAKDPADRPPLTDVLARLAGPWPTAGWLPPAVMDMIASRESASAGALASEAAEPDHPLHGQPTVDPPPERRVRRRAALLTGLVASLGAVGAIAAGAMFLLPPESAKPSAAPQESAEPSPALPDPAKSSSASPESAKPTVLPESAEPSATRGRVVTDDGRAFGPGGWSQFTVTVDPSNDGVRLTRRLDSSVFGQSATLSVNGKKAGRWVPMAGALTVWVDQTVELPRSATKGRKVLTVRNTFESSTKDFNEFTYFVDQKVDGLWRRADVVDIGPSNLAEEKAHRYRIEEKTWEGTRTFRYRGT
ncbi:serine/threonine protein kinase [Streptomyces oryzae]|uniref:Serine/threonine protein kinase n=1 Tax=Streptomyces oryzae TaxID=1434886 RepID=A0ABS3X527_9ACTN|nr:serine/threonine-protein kinase [Streptomyces oryzae]MBO8190207.1 serine/threonine protein kinase [Streptomyces oryzae]